MGNGMGGATGAPVAVGRGTQAYLRLRELIVQGRLAPGTRVSESGIAERLVMSRTPVRSALQRLEQEGFILVEGTGRLRKVLVAPLTRARARDVFHILAALEGAAARAAAALDSDVRQARVHRMRQLNDELRTISVSSAPESPRRLWNDNAFHECFLDAAGPRLRALHRAVRPQAEQYLRVYVSRLTEASIAEHDAIIEAFGAGDADRAQQAVETNWRNAAERLARVIEVRGERGSW